MQTELLELKIQRNEIRIAMVSIMILALIGTFLNIIAVTLNNGRMPVLYENENYIINTQTHFSYTLEQKQYINRWFITDIIPIGNRAVMSIGDLLIFLAIPLTIYAIIKNIKINKKIKECKQ